MSDHSCQVVPVELLDHPDADSLSIVKVWGYTVVVRTSDWADVDRGVYIQPDSMVPNSPPFKFLFNEGDDRCSRSRIKVRKLRGVISQGLLVPVGLRSDIGYDYASKWDIWHYEPVISTAGSDNVAGPSGLIAPKYDVENLNRYNEVIDPGEPVYITEKIHGASARYVYHEGEMFCGSRGQWKKESDKCLWWGVFRSNDWLEGFCESNPGMIVYGEVFGKVQDLNYGHDTGASFLCFDLLKNGAFLGFSELEMLVPEERRTPVLFTGPFDDLIARALAEGESCISAADHCREGAVVCTITEKTDISIGRKQLKIVGNGYLSRKSNESKR